MASNTRILEGKLVYQKRGMVPICANIASQQFRFAYDRLKGACILYTLTFFLNFEHLKHLKELNGVDKLATELEVAQN